LCAPCALLGRKTDHLALIRSWQWAHKEGPKHLENQGFRAIS
jgi:hypothetical protein